VLVRTATDAVEALRQRRTRSLATRRRTVAVAGKKEDGKSYAHSAGVPKVLRRALAQVPANRPGSRRKRLPALRGMAHRLLNVAHLSHDPADRRWLAVLCPSCHAKKRHATTPGDDAPQSGQAAGPVVAERRDSMGTTPGKDLAFAI
jgi:hypothetical protein